MEAAKIGFSPESVSNGQRGGNMQCRQNLQGFTHKGFVSCSQRCRGGKVPRVPAGSAEIGAKSACCPLRLSIISLGISIPEFIRVLIQGQQRMWAVKFREAHDPTPRWPQDIGSKCLPCQSSICSVVVTLLSGSQSSLPRACLFPERRLWTIDALQPLKYSGILLICPQVLHHRSHGLAPR